MLVAMIDPSKRGLFGCLSVGGLPQTYRSDRFLLYSDGHCPRQSNRSGDVILIGTIHVRSSADQDPIYAIDNESSLCNDDMLLNRCWGSYIAVFSTGGRLCLMRDPSGTLPCFYTISNGLIFASSDVSLLLDAVGQEPRIDWDELGWLLVANELPQEQTALAGISELLPGCALNYDGRSVTSRERWSPWDHVDPQAAPSPDILREQFEKVIRTIAGRYRSALIGVSGGLDSSIVAACALRSSAQIHAITVSTDDAHGDEAGFAGALCEQLGLPLIREQYRLDNVDIARSTAEHLPRPGGRAQLQAYDRVVLDHAARLGCDVFLSGVGGDNVFYYTNSPRALVDHYLAEGVGRYLIGTLRDICQLTGASWYEALRRAIAVPRVANAIKYDWRADTRFIHARHRERLRGQPLRHSWLEASREGLPGKAAHIAMLIRASHYIDAQSQGSPVASVQPLLAQPIVEMCLAIPTWELCRGGVDRSLVRTAFAGRLPTSVIERRTKGGPDGFAHQILRRNLTRVRQRLLNGLLAEHQVIDPDALDTHLCENRMMRGTDYARILLLLDTEAWARHWQTWPHREPISINGSARRVSSPASDPLLRGGADQPGTGQEARN